MNLKRQFGKGFARRGSGGGDSQQGEADGTIIGRGKQGLFDTKKSSQVIRVSVRGEKVKKPCPGEYQFLGMGGKEELGGGNDGGRRPLE